MIDVLVSARRDAAAARRFFQRALRMLKVTPSEVVTDAAPVYPAVLDDLISSARHHVERYANNPIEADHSQLKHRLRPMRDQGRHLGGRPPYGYRLVDAGPHPNTVHARWGRRLHRLDPDPVTAPHVHWIFAQRIAGTSAAGIARTLNHLGVPSPSQYDRSRNPHRTAEGWTVRTVAEILANPRYTGRQVWNRQYTDHQETEPGDRRTSRGSVRRWNPRDQWVLSARLVHPPLVSESDFVQAQTVNAIATPEDGQPRRYLLTGLIVCRTCGRRADAHWVHGRPGYRCRHGHTSASPPLPGRPKPLYLREDLLLAHIARQLADRTTEALDDARATAAYLRANQITITCDADTITLGRQPLIVRIPRQKQRPPPEPL